MLVNCNMVQITIISANYNITTYRAYIYVVSKPMDYTPLNSECINKNSYNLKINQEEIEKIAINTQKLAKLQSTRVN